MQFTKATNNIKFHINSKPFRRDVEFACKLGHGTAKLADIAQRIAGGNAHALKSNVVTNEHWEKAREERGKARYINGRITTAREHVADVIELTANAVGASLSATKHALETNHDIQVERRFTIDTNAAELDSVLAQLAKDGVRISHSNGRFYKHKHIYLEFGVLVANLHEQATSYYAKKGMK